MLKGCAAAAVKPNLRPNVESRGRGRIFEIQKAAAAAEFFDQLFNTRCDTMVHILIAQCILLIMLKYQGRAGSESYTIQQAGPIHTTPAQ